MSDRLSGAPPKTGRRRLPSAEEVVGLCAQPAPPELIAGLEEFNAGLYFECHETLELLWRARPGPERWLYQGILQVGIGLHHLRRRNGHGAVALLERGLRLLLAYPDRCQGVNVKSLREQAETIRDFLVAEGTAGLERFDWSRAPKIEVIVHSDFHPPQEG